MGHCGSLTCESRYDTSEEGVRPGEAVGEWGGRADECNCSPKAERAVLGSVGLASSEA